MSHYWIDGHHLVMVESYEPDAVDRLRARVAFVARLMRRSGQSTQPVEQARVQDWAARLEAALADTNTADRYV